MLDSLELDDVRLVILLEYGLVALEVVESLRLVEVTGVARVLEFVVIELLVLPDELLLTSEEELYDELPLVVEVTKVEGVMIVVDVGEVNEDDTVDESDPELEEELEGVS